MSEAVRHRTIAGPGRLASPLVLLAAMWIVRLADTMLPGTFNTWGLRSWDLGSAPGILFGPLLHSGWPHLIANTVPFLLLGCLVALDGTARFWSVTVIVALVGGAGTWAINAPGTLTIGASVLVFGYFSYTVLRVFEPGRPHRVAHALIALGVIGLYGATMVAGIISAGPGISWQAHLFGAIGGAVAALLGGRSKRREA